jgi:hypothetical protein
LWFISACPSVLMTSYAQRHHDSRRMLTALRYTFKKKHNRTQFLESGLWGYLIIMSKAGWAPTDNNSSSRQLF